MIFECIQVGELQVNCYILAEGRGMEAVIIDPGEDLDEIRKVLDKHALRPGLVVNTHGHVDHIGCSDKFGVAIYIHKEDAVLLKNPGLNLSLLLGSNFRVNPAANVKPVEEKDVIALGNLKLEVIHTPGHTSGGICLLLKFGQDKILFTGDSLFHRSIGRTDFPGASQDLLLKSIKEKLLVLPEDTVIYPGHGPRSTIGEEIKRNPFLN